MMERHYSRTLSEVWLLCATTMYCDVALTHLIEGCGCLYRTGGSFAEAPGLIIQCGKAGCVCAWDTEQHISSAGRHFGELPGSILRHGSCRGRHCGAATYINLRTCCSTCTAVFASEVRRLAKCVLNSGRPVLIRSFGRSRGSKSGRGGGGRGAPETTDQNRSA